MNYETYSFPNGIRLIHSQVPNLIAHLGIIMNTGTRDEALHEHGMAHLAEHMLFKGTAKRKAYHIISRLEDAGGEINAYTTKEETCLYTSFLKQDYGRALELIQDVIFHSTYPQKEISREKEVIIDEINSYLDNPSELIFDDFEELLFNGQPIGRNILGTAESLNSINRKELTDFMGANYFTDEMVLCSVGNISFRRLVSLAGRYFSEVPDKRRTGKRLPVAGYQPSEKTILKNTYQAHSIIGATAYSFMDERRFGMHLLNNILGGPGLNTRLNMSLRERNGYSYHAESHYSPYSDSGVVMVYFSGDKNKLDKSSRVVMRELRKLREEKLGTLQLHRAKKQLMGQVAISAENHESLMLSMAKSYLIFNKFDSLEETGKKIDNITAEQINGIANEIFTESRLSRLAYR
jgi:predicted Zn-dependent peptidase